MKAYIVAAVVGGILGYVLLQWWLLQQTLRRVMDDRLCPAHPKGNSVLSSSNGNPSDFERKAALLGW